MDVPRERGSSAGDSACAVCAAANERRCAAEAGRGAKSYESGSLDASVGGELEAERPSRAGGGDQLLGDLVWPMLAGDADAREPEP